MTDTTFTPAARTTLATSVLDQLLDQLRLGALKPGDRLPSERTLMEQFGVGRSTIREALQSLARMNLIESRPGAGTLVKAVDFNTYLRPDIFAVLLGAGAANDLLEAREIIEVAIVDLAAQRATAEDCVAIEALLDQAAAALARHEPTTDLSILFHMTLAQAAHNSVVSTFMHSIYELLRVRSRRALEMPSFLRWEIESHREIYELVKGGDAAGARQAMRDHLRHSAEQLGELGR